MAGIGNYKGKKKSNKSGGGPRKKKTTKKTTKKSYQWKSLKIIMIGMKNLLQDSLHLQ